MKNHIEAEIFILFNHYRNINSEKAGCFFVSFLNSITPYMKMILPPLEKGDRGGFSRWIAPKSPLAPLFQRGGILSILVVISGHKSVRCNLRMIRFFAKGDRSTFVKSEKIG